MPDGGREVLATAVRVLRAVSETAPPGQITRIARLTGLPYSTVHRVLRQLVDQRMVARVDGRYVVGVQLLDLAARLEPVPGLRSAAAAVMGSLRDHTGATLSLATVQDDAAVLLEVAAGRTGLPYPVRGGHRLRATAAASLVLADPRGVGTMRSGRSPRRVVVGEGEDLPGLSCYAVAIELPGRAVAALQLSASGGRPAEAFSGLVDRAAHMVGASVRPGRDG